MSKEVKVEELSLYEQMGGIYTEIDGIFYPNITLGEEIAEQNDFCGKYGDMWKKHMYDNREADYRHYLFTGKLNEKAKEINEQAKMQTELSKGLKRRYFLIFRRCWDYML